MCVIVDEAKHILLEVKVRRIIVDTNVVTALQRSRMKGYVVVEYLLDRWILLCLNNQFHILLLAHAKVALHRILLSELLHQ